MSAKRKRPSQQPRGWPTAAQFQRPDREAVERSMIQYCRVVRNEQRPQNRPGFQFRPEDWHQPICSSLATSSRQTAFFCLMSRGEDLHPQPAVYKTAALLLSYLGLGDGGQAKQLLFC